MNIGATNEVSVVSAVSKPYLHELEYIESTGTQRIDSGYIPNKNTEITAKLFLVKMAMKWEILVVLFVMVINIQVGILVC